MCTTNHHPRIHIQIFLRQTQDKSEVYVVDMGRSIWIFWQSNITLLVSYIVSLLC